MPAMTVEQKEKYVSSNDPFNGPDRVLLARLDERIDFVLKQLNVIREEMKTKVPYPVFVPVRAVVYSIVGAIGMGVVFSWLWVVLIHPSP